MGTYLVIAEKVLENSLEPLNALEILKRAYLDDLIPTHLYGKTQHKTLHARISEDIRKYGERSSFYRVEPGVFFLRRLKERLDDQQVTEFFARPRFRELHRNPVMIIPEGTIAGIRSSDDFLGIIETKKLLKHKKIHFKNIKQLTDKQDIPVWAFVIVCKDQEILTYRQGHYRQQRDSFLNQRTIGFSSLVEHGSATLFDTEDHGLVSSGLKSAIADLGFSEHSIDLHEEKKQAALEFSFVFEDISSGTELVCVVTYECPVWLEPSKRKLAINDLQWVRTSHPVNNIDDFDPWSKKIISKIFALRQKRAA